MLRIIGVGICEGHLTERAKALIEQSEVVYGSERAILLAEKWIKGETRVMKRFNSEAYSEIEKESIGKEVAVLSTGDPMVAGLGKFFRNAEIEPGISSVQVALSKLKVDLCDVIVVNAHGRRFEVGNRSLLILADKGFDLKLLGDREVVLLEDLCSKERIKRGLASEMKLESNNSMIYVKVV
ncbi:MAG: precorrin-6y C5,15-methyltransferase (decarboxylating) subunit CbiE [Archaeoglobaceae archaeon]